VRLRFIALVLLVIAATAAGFVLTRVDSSRDAWLVFGTGLALAATAPYYGGYYADPYYYGYRPYAYGYGYPYGYRRAYYGYGGYYPYRRAYYAYHRPYYRYAAYRRYW